MVLKLTLHCYVPDINPLSFVNSSSEIHRNSSESFASDRKRSNNDHVCKIFSLGSLAAYHDQYRREKHLKNKRTDKIIRKFVSSLPATVHHRD